MTRPSKRCILGVTLACSLLFALALPAFAEDIIYPGYTLAPDPYAPLSSSLFPASGSLSGNTVTVGVPGQATPAISESVYGGMATLGTVSAVTGNAVTINDGPIGNNVFGAVSFQGGNVLNNAVIVNGGTVAALVVGGSSTYWPQFGDATTGEVSGNTVTINGGSIGSGVTGGESSAFSNEGNATTGAVHGNTVTINGGTATVYSIVGGTASTLAAPSGSATLGSVYQNTVTMTGGAASSIVGGGSFAQGGNTTVGGAVYENAVTLSGGTVQSSLTGGMATSGPAYNNSVTISGGTVQGDITGGFSFGDATGNIVTISGSPDLSQAGLHGGYAYTGISSGNILNLMAAGITVAALDGFQLLNFYLPTTMGAGGTMLTVTGTANIANAKVNVGVNGASSPLRAGDTVTLINAGTLNATGVNTFANGQGMQGVTLLYDFTISVDGNKLLATVGTAPANTTTNGTTNNTTNGTANQTNSNQTNASDALSAWIDAFGAGSGVRVNPQTKALSEGFISSATLVNQGLDLVAGQGMSQAVTAAQTAADAGRGLGVFGAISGGWSRYNTGSHTDVSGVSVLAGLSWGADMSAGRFTLGGFFQYGNGAYNTYNSFASAASVNANGTMYSLGGGILGRMDFSDSGPGHVYAEASGQIGGVHNHFNGSDLRDAFGRSADYDADSTYYGLHGGLGYVWNIAEKTSLDVYGKYLWTRQTGESVRLSTGDPVSFKDVDSSRLRGGARLTYAATDKVKPFIGVAYEHELDGKARATTNGYAIKAPDLGGGTGIGELGLTFKPSEKHPLAIDLGVQGYVGTRQGVNGNLQVKYEF